MKPGTTYKIPPEIMALIEKNKPVKRERFSIAQMTVMQKCYDVGLSANCTLKILRESKIGTHREKIMAQFKEWSARDAAK